LSIIDAVADYAKAHDVKNIALTGTRFTMSDGFYQEGLEKHGLSVCLPDETEQEQIHNIIYNELVRGEINSRSVKDFNEIAQSLLHHGSDAVLLGCTELALLTQETSASMKLIDSTSVHADAALKASFSNQLP
jgi:aspartate racemase